MAPKKQKRKIKVKIKKPRLNATKREWADREREFYDL
jgi:hypothetical protein